MATSEDFKFVPGDVVEHRKGGEYTVINVATIEATGQRCYVYESRDREVWVRPVGEMEDGRFRRKTTERQLTAEAEADREDFVREHGRDGNCSCHISPPCGSCMHPGNPLNQDECDECWEDVPC
jgi:hypothetical protein